MVHLALVAILKDLCRIGKTLQLKKLGELVSQSRALQVFLDSCVKCGACTDKCHYYLGTSDPKNMPVARQDLLRSVYRHYFTFAGKYFLSLSVLADTLAGLDEDVKEETGVDVKFPLNMKGAEVLVITPSDDFFAEPHIDGLSGYGKVFHAAGIS